MTLETTKYNEVLLLKVLVFQYLTLGIYTFLRSMGVIDYKSPYNHNMERAFNYNLVERIQFLAC